MGPFACLGFLTDYGVEDGFVAACHGVAARLAPAVRVIDITHLVPPGDVRRGAAVLAQTIGYLPAGVHVAVVDPGVGTPRRAVAARAGDCVVVGPDNGVLSWAAAAKGGAVEAVELTNSDWWLHPVSSTFHGRDIFMPAGARLAAGAPLAEAGAPIDPASLEWLPAPPSWARDGQAEGEVLSVDRFGNVQLSVPASDADQIGIGFGAPVTVRTDRHRLTAPYLRTFAAAAPGEAVVFADSAGFVSIAVNGGHAARRLGLSPGARVRLSATPE